MKDAPLRSFVRSSAPGARSPQERGMSRSEPRPQEVLHDIGRVIAFCLSLALLARLVLAVRTH